MILETFLEMKTNLTNLINESLTESNITDKDKTSLIKLKNILDLYTFENRINRKGLLTHTIIDSLDIDYSLGEKFLKFDNKIT